MSTCISVPITNVNMTKSLCYEVLRVPPLPHDAYTRSSPLSCFSARRKEWIGPATLEASTRRRRGRGHFFLLFFCFFLWIPHSARDTALLYASAPQHRPEPRHRQAELSDRLSRPRASTQRGGEGEKSEPFCSWWRKGGGESIASVAAANESFLVKFTAPTG